jgi:hypothetical protein
MEITGLFGLSVHDATSPRINMRRTMIASMTPVHMNIFLLPVFSPTLENAK